MTAPILDPVNKQVSQHRTPRTPLFSASLFIPTAFLACDPPRSYTCSTYLPSCKTTNPIIMNKLKSMLKGDKKDKDSSSTAPTQSSTSSQPQSSSTGQTAAAGQTGASSTTGGTPKGVLFNTTLGDITIALYTDETPKVRITASPQTLAAPGKTPK